MVELKKMYPARETLVTRTTASITVSDTVIPVSDAAAFPEGPNILTIGTDNAFEIIIYGEADAENNRLTGCQRGQSDTAAKAWPSGSLIYHSWTALNANAIMGNVNALSDAAGNLLLLIYGLSDAMPKIKVYPLILSADNWQNREEGGFYYEVENAALKEDLYITVSFDMASLDISSDCGLSPEFEVLDGKLIFRSKTVPNADMTGEYIIIAESGDTVISVGSRLEQIAVSEQEAQSLLEILKTEN